MNFPKQIDRDEKMVVPFFHLYQFVLSAEQPGNPLDSQALHLIDTNHKRKKSEWQPCPYKSDSDILLLKIFHCWRLTGMIKPL